MSEQPNLDEIISAFAISVMERIRENRGMKDIHELVEKEIRAWHKKEAMRVVQDWRIDTNKRYAHYDPLDLIARFEESER